MSALAVFLFMIAVLAVLLSLGFWVGLALVATGITGLFLMGAPNIGGLIGSTLFSAINSWPLTALPLFLLMGEILFRSKISEDLFRGLAPLTRRLPGGLLHVNILGSGILAAIVGSSGVCCATVGRMSLPELKARGYDERMAIGTLTGSGTLGLLIPPSIMMIVYGISTQTSVARLFLAGVVPGLLMVVLFMGYVAIWSLIHRDRAPVHPAGEETRLADLARIAAPVVLIIAVIGSIYGGLATPTESAAIGVAGAFLLALAQRALTLKTLLESFMAAVRSSALIMLIMAGAAVLSTALAYAQIPVKVAAFVTAMQLGPIGLLLALTVLYVVLGCFLEGVSMIVLTASVVMPMVAAVGIDPVWFGIFVVIIVEIAQITPPVGFNLFIVQALTGRDIATVTRASLPFLMLMLAAIVLITAVPELVLFLPQTMIGQ
ncbi:TRAP transporter large permease subunit [Martelella sp. HB161492]|uniref:TRAP transporter large permease n=1 Tax=Martelella sp. HB161492 TaxID=2720726 RepID=UPI001591FCE3|nr:TRAP transporter large permease subunit [Martelella sp. HB161492]